MKHFYKILFFNVLLLICLNNVYAQSPLTNICFYKLYKDFGVVSEAEKAGILNYHIAQQLMNPKIASDIKAAMINALSFEILGTENAEKFIFYLKLKYKFDDFETFIDSLNSDEIFCFAYLKLMDDYFEPENSYKYFEKAISKNPESYTYQLIFSLAMAQEVFLYNRCKAWKLVEQVLNNTNYTGLMLPEAIDLITEFMKVYQADCL